MAFFQYLVFDGENLPLPDSYEVELEDVEADSGGETEAGTTQRDVVRHGVAPVSYTHLDVYKRQPAEERAAQTLEREVEKALR